MTTEESTKDARPHSRRDLARLVDSEIDKHLGSADPLSDQAYAQLARTVALDVAWTEIDRLTHERDNAIGVVLEELDEERTADEQPRPFPLRPDLHAARLLARHNLVAALRELYMILNEAFSWDGRIHPHEELVAAYVNDIANAAENQAAAPTLLWPAETTAVDGEAAELRVLRDDVAQLVGIGLDGTGRIERSSILAALTRCISLGGIAGELKLERDELRAGVERILAETDTLPCQDGKCPGPVASPLPHCSLCHIRMGLRELLATAVIGVPQ